MENLRIILIPLSHDNQEGMIEKNLIMIINGLNIKNISIYWESKVRSERKSNLHLGLEDPVLLAVFELTVFIISTKDGRLYKEIYEGMGRVNPEDKDKGKDIPNEAILAAKGSEAILNLRLSPNKLYK